MPEGDAEGEGVGIMIPMTVPRGVSEGGVGSRTCSFRPNLDASSGSHSAFEVPSSCSSRQTREAVHRLTWQSRQARIASMELRSSEAQEVAQSGAWTVSMAQQGGVYTKIPDVQS